MGIGFRMESLVRKVGNGLNKRIEKKMFSRMWRKTYKEYKEKNGNSWKGYCREQKQMKKHGKPKVKLEEIQDLIDIGLYTREEAEAQFEIIEN